LHLIIKQGEPVLNTERRRLFPVIAPVIWGWFSPAVLSALPNLPVRKRVFALILP
jgi:hypothetical protein